MKKIKNTMRLRQFAFTAAMCAASFSAEAKPYVKIKMPTKKENTSTIKHFAKEAEEKYKLPENLLMAIAHFESNKSCFAINAKGRGHFFKTQEEASAFIETLANTGYKNMNVGLMQINFASHRHRFKSATDMVDPRQNIMYAAQLLAKLKRVHGSWERAVEAYKGNFSETSQKYRSKIFSLRFKLPKITLPSPHKKIVHVKFSPLFKHCLTSTQKESSKRNENFSFTVQKSVMTRV